MSRIRANLITNQTADGAPTVQNGLIVSGVSTSIQHQATNVNVTGVVTATCSPWSVPGCFSPINISI